VHPKNFVHPGITLEKKEKAKILFNAIELLNERQKTCFVLKHVEGLSQKEIAEIMQCAEGAVESMLSRAKANLRNLLGDYFDKNEL
jgi:RNA polymerase sigma-70 factor (ECF subfamily)